MILWGAFQKEWQQSKLRSSSLRIKTCFPPPWCWLGKLFTPRVHFHCESETHVYANKKHQIQQKLGQKMCSEKKGKKGEKLARKLGLSGTALPSCKVLQSASQVSCMRWSQTQLNDVFFFSGSAQCKIQLENREFCSCNSRFAGREASSHKLLAKDLPRRARLVRARLPNYFLMFLKLLSCHEFFTAKTRLLKDVHPWEKVLRC